MRSPTEAGVGGSIPFVTPSDVVGAYVSMRNAITRLSRYGEEIVFTLELLADQFDQNGNAIPLVFKMSQKVTPGREEFVGAFAVSREPIGPFVIVQLPALGDDLSGAIVFNDASDVLDPSDLARPKVTRAGAKAIARAARDGGAPSVNGAPVATVGRPVGLLDSAPATITHDALAAVGTRKHSKLHDVWYVKTRTAGEWLRADLYEIEQATAALPDDVAF